MKFRPVGGRFLVEERRTDRNDEANSYISQLCKRGTRANHLYTLFILVMASDRICKCEEGYCVIFLNKLF